MILGGTDACTGPKATSAGAYEMARGWIHTIYKAGTWVNEIENEGQLSSHWTKEEAVAAGRATARARRSEHIIHFVHGGIAERNSYGSDPYPPAG